MYFSIFYNKKMSCVAPLIACSNCFTHISVFNLDWLFVDAQTAAVDI